MKLKYIASSLLFCTFISQANTENFQASLVKDINPGSGSGVSKYTTLFSTPNNVFFSANDGEHGWEVWQSDGSFSGTKMVKDFPGTSSVRAVIGNNIFLISKADNSDEYKLIKLDSITGESVVLLKSNASIPTEADAPPPFHPPFSNFSNVKDKLFFTLYDSEGSKTWRSDGSAEGTIALSAPPKSQLVELNSSIIFFSTEDRNKLWILKNVNSEASEINGDFGSIDKVFKLNNTLFFLSHTTEKHNLWKFDGNNVSLVKKLPNGIGSINTESIVVNNTLFFIVQEATHNELWSSDGTATGTNKLISESTVFYGLNNINGTLFFSSRKGRPERDHSVMNLWKSDGSVAGTSLVKTITRRGRFKFMFLSKAHIDDTLYFTVGADDGLEYGRNEEIWKSDGSEEGTQMVQYVLPEITSFQPRNLFTIGNKLFFSVDDDVHGRELWTLASSEEIAPPICATGVDPQTIQVGEGTALWWWSDSAETASINQGIESINLPTDFKWIYPEKTTTYSVTVTGANGSTATCDATIVVEGQAEATPPVCEMGADPQTITVGEGTALWWWADSVATATVDNNIGSVTVPSDYKWFYPTTTATYTMTAVGDNGQTVNCATTIEVAQ